MSEWVLVLESVLVVLGSVLVEMEQGPEQAQGLQGLEQAQGLQVPEQGLE